MRQKRFGQVKFVFVLAVLAFFTWDSSPAFSSEDYPNRNVEIIAAWGVGGGTDTMCRKVAKLLQDRFDNATFSVVNIPGAAGTQGINELLAKPADGYTIVSYTSSTHNFLSVKETGIKLGEDLVPLARLNNQPGWIYTHPDGPAKDAKSFIEYVKKNRARVAVSAVSNPGAVFFVDRANAEADLKMEKIVYSSVKERHTAVMGGHDPFLYEQMGNVEGLVKAGRLIPVMRISDERHPKYPDVMCTKDVGLEGYSAPMFRGLAVHAETPQHKIDILTEALRDIVKTEEWIEWMEGSFMLPEESFLGPEEFYEFAKEMETLAQKYWPEEEK